MTQPEKVVSLAQILVKDLSKDGLLRYISEQERMIANERKYGRSTAKYEFYHASGKLALSMLDTEDCTHDDLDHGICLDCKEDLSSELGSRAYDRYKDLMKYGE
jgi:hypothetical protein